MTGIRSRSCVHAVTAVALLAAGLSLAGRASAAEFGPICRNADISRLEEHRIPALPDLVPARRQRACNLHVPRRQRQSRTLRCRLAEGRSLGQIHRRSERLRRPLAARSARRSMDDRGRRLRRTLSPPAAAHPHRLARGIQRAPRDLRRSRGGLDPALERLAILHRAAGSAGGRRLRRQILLGVEQRGGGERDDPAIQGDGRAGLGRRHGRRIVPLSPTWATTGWLRYDRLVGDAGASPITTKLGTANQVSFGLILSYSFVTKKLF